MGVDEPLQAFGVGNVGDGDVRSAILAGGSVDLDVPDPHDSLPDGLGDADVSDVVVEDFAGSFHGDRGTGGPHG